MPVGFPASGSSKGSVVPRSRRTPPRFVSQTAAARGSPAASRAEWLESRRCDPGRWARRARRSSSRSRRQGCERRAGTEPRAGRRRASRARAGARRAVSPARSRGRGAVGTASTLGEASQIFRRGHRPSSQPHPLPLSSAPAHSASARGSGPERSISPEGHLPGRSRNPHPRSSFEARHPVPDLEVVAHRVCAEAARCVKIFLHLEQATQ
jgi:hypothetical protein